MKKITILLVSAFAMMGCKPEFQGQLKVVDQSLPTVVNGHTVSFPTGIYNTVLKLNSKSKATLTVKTAKTSYDLVLQIPSSVQIPSENGPINLTAKQSGQPFDLAGQMATNTYQTEVQSGQQSCQIQEPETVCWGGPRPGCDTRWVTRPGWQQVQYYDVVTEKSLNAEIRQTGTAHVSANLSVSNSDSQRHYLSQGPCF